MPRSQSVVGRSRLIAWPALLLAGLATVVATGRAWPQTPQAPAQPPAATAPTPTFKASTQLMEVDVMVEDGRGRFVSDLARGDFELLEDGHRQTIDTFGLVGAPGGAAGGSPASTASGPTASGTEQPTAMASSRPILVFVFDNAHLTTGTFGSVQQALEAFIPREFTGVPIGGVVAYGGLVNGHLTTKEDELLKVVKALRAQPGSAALQARGTTSQLMATMAALMKGLAKFPGAKTVVFVSDGFGTAGSWPEVQQVIDLAARSRTRIYTIDPRGLGFATDNTQTAGTVARRDPVPQAPSAALGADNPFSGPEPMPSGQPTDGPNALAVETGGFVVRHTNDFTGALQRIAGDTRTYYVLGYHPTNTDFQGRFRKIEVKVKRHGVTVRARRGYLGLVRPQ